MIPTSLSILFGRLATLGQIAASHSDWLQQHGIDPTLVQDKLYDHEQFLISRFQALQESIEAATAGAESLSKQLLELPEGPGTEILRTLAAGKLDESFQSLFSNILPSPGYYAPPHAPYR
jgi:hypothetical protein